MMPDEYASFGDDVSRSEMPINVQKKGWEDILRKQCIEKVNTDPDEIDISSDDSDLEENDNIDLQCRKKASIKNFFCAKFSV